MTRLFLALLLLPSCVREPANREVAAPEGADDATAMSVAEWSRQLDAELDVRDVPEIRWFQGKCMGSFCNCLDYGDGVCYYGDSQETPTDAQIHLAVFPTLHESALGHELLHWALGESRGDSDHDHEGPEWGAPLGEVVGVLADAGL